MASEKVSVSKALREAVQQCVKLRHRGLMVLLGPEARQQVMILHHLLSKASGERPSILWCHKKESQIPRHSRKQLKKLEKNISSGKSDVSQENAFELFLLSTPIRHCALHETHRVLGNTYGMCVIQDLDSLTPNRLCRVVECVSGGGLVVLLPPPHHTSLRQLFTLPMEIHSRLKTHSHPKVTPLFNERLVLSLGWCGCCLVLDEHLQLMGELPALSTPPLPPSAAVVHAAEASQAKLAELRESLQDANKPLPQLVGCCRTMDQAQAVLKMIDLVTEKTLRGTVSLTAGRGRGKSAALGLATAAAIHLGLNNICVTSPTPENLGTYFEFLFKGFDSLGYEEQTDYEIIQSTCEEYNGAVVRVSVFREYRQTVQYISPTDIGMLGQCELVVVDEAAAIPLPHVKALIAPCNAIMASTVNGYEGTGRSLSLKLLQQLRRQAGQGGAAVVATSNSSETNISLTRRSLQEVTLEESVRYAPHDPVEAWLHRLLCLDATHLPPANTCPPPRTCHLYYVNRPVLFSGHSESESFLQQAVALLSASHYKNSPDDLQVLSDAPAHHLFVLLPPLTHSTSKTSSSTSSLPTILAVIQVCLEGGIPAAVSGTSLSHGERPSGDLVAWLLATQFMRPPLTEMRGARVVRVATHPDYQSMGYGSRAIKLLSEYYTGQHLSLDDPPAPSSPPHTLGEEKNKDKNVIVPKVNSDPLLCALGERRPEHLDYLSVSYGVTLPLLKFWCRAGYLPLYVSQVANKVTGEHSCVMVNPLSTQEETQAADDSRNLPPWLVKAAEEFLRRLVWLLGGPLRGLHPSLILAMLQAHSKSVKWRAIEWEELKLVVNGHDLVRLEKYCQNLADRHLITDILPHFARLFFTHRFPSLHFSPIQSSLIAGLGLQQRTFEDMATLLDLPLESVLGQFNRAARRAHRTMASLQETALAKHLPTNTARLQEFVPVAISLDEDLEDAAKEYEEKEQKKEEKRRQTHALLGDISRFAITSEEGAWEEALKGKQSGVVSVKSNKRPAVLNEKDLEKEMEEPKQKKGKKSKPAKKKKNKTY